MIVEFAYMRRSGLTDYQCQILCQLLAGMLVVRVKLLPRARGCRSAEYIQQHELLECDYVALDHYHGDVWTLRLTMHGFVAAVTTPPAKARRLLRQRPYVGR